MKVDIDMGSIPKERGLIRARVYYIVQLKTAYGGDDWTDWCDPGGEPYPFPFKPDAQDKGEELLDYDWVFKFRVVRVWEKWFTEGDEDDGRD